MSGAWLGLVLRRKVKQNNRVVNTYSGAAEQQTIDDNQSGESPILILDDRKTAYTIEEQEPNS